MNALRFFAAGCLLAPALSFAANLEGRVVRLENLLSNQRYSELLLEIQRLQQEVQQLRGLAEQQGYALELLQRQQKDQYLDLDARLRAREGEPAGASTGADPGTDPAAAPGQGAAAEREREAYRQAFELLKQRRYEEAAAQLGELLTRHPQGEYADNARYWLGETYYVQRNYSAALAEFQRLLDEYPHSPKVAGAMLKMGYIQDDRKDWKQARAILEALIRAFPQGTEARLAARRLEAMTQQGH